MIDNFKNGCNIMSLTCEQRTKIWLLWSAIVFGIIGFFLLVTLLPLSFKEVNHDEYGIHWRNVLFKVDDSDPLEEGRHLLKPDSHVYLYPAKNVLYEDNYFCMSSDGVEIHVTIAVQYIYNKHEIVTTFNEFGESDKSETFVQLTIVDAVRDACSNVTAADFFLRRGTVEGLIVHMVSNHLVDSGTHVTSGGSTQLKNFQYPPSFGNVIEEIQATEQQIQVLLNRREQELTAAETVLRQAEVKKGTKIREAEISSQAIVFEAEQDALAQATFWNKTADAYELAFENYKGSGSATFDDFVNDYLFSNLLSQFDAPVVSLTSTT